MTFVCTMCLEYRPGVMRWKSQSCTGTSGHDHLRCCRGNIRVARFQRELKFVCNFLKVNRMLFTKTNNNRRRRALQRRTGWKQTILYRSVDYIEFWDHVQDLTTTLVGRVTTKYRFVPFSYFRPKEILSSFLVSNLKTLKESPITKEISNK